MSTPVGEEVGPVEVRVGVGLDMTWVRGPGGPQWRSGGCTVGDGTRSPRRTYLRSGDSTTLRQGVHPSSRAVPVGSGPLKDGDERVSQEATGGHCTQLTPRPGNPSGRRGWGRSGRTRRDPRGPKLKLDRSLLPRKSPESGTLVSRTRHTGRREVHAPAPSARPPAPPRLPIQSVV